MISVSGLAKAYGDRTLFAGASFQLNPGHRYGLVGANGSGKTTLLGILGGTVEASDGSVSVPKSVRVGTLLQDQFLFEEETVMSVALMGNQALWEAMRRKEELLAQGEQGFDVHLFGELEETFQLHDGYAAEARAATVLEGLGIPTEQHHEPLATLSGGFKLRVLLAQVLASAPDVLLLDEPTNHLDILSIRWLEKFLRDFAGPAVVISHDHRFLDNVVTDILDVDYETVTLYAGNYTRFQDAKREERERREKEIETREREIAHHQKFVDRFRAKNTKARQAQSKLRLIEKLSETLEPLPGSSRRYPTFRFDQVRASGRDVLSVKDLKKSFGDNRVLNGVDLTVRRGERLAIIGPNGIGKSTLLKILVGKLEADAGSAVWGYEAHPGYFAQDQQEQFEALNRTAEEWLWDFCPGKDRGFVRGQMGLVLFSGDDGAKPLEALSGGEAARLVFARLAVQRPNVLVLDEPTNHLDLESIEALVEGLRAYEGTIILVSHDRWFVGELATRIVEIRSDGIRDYLGTYQEYVHACGDDHLDADTVVLKARRERKAKKEGASTDGERDVRRAGARATASRARLEERRDELTGQIEVAEARIAEIDEIFCDPGYFERTGSEEVAFLERERSSAQDRVAELLEAWEEVERDLERLG